MTAKNQIIATLVGFIVVFLLGWLIYGVLLMDFYESNAGTATNVYKSETEMTWWALIAGNFIQAYFLVYIFRNMSEVTTFSAGLKTGFIIGLILGLAFNLVMYGTSNIMNLTSALVDSIVTAVMMAITGGVIAMILGRK